jgi:hypothetical protein
MGGLRRLKTDVMLGIYERWAGRDLNMPQRDETSERADGTVQQIDLALAFT